VATAVAKALINGRRVTALETLNHHEEHSSTLTCAVSGHDGAGTVSRCKQSELCGVAALPPGHRSTQQAQKRRRLAVAIIFSGVAPSAFRRRSAAPRARLGAGRANPERLTY
jgi:hypothetical protein